ncbi:uncharacterized protein LOC122926101 [Bufo gargarizans]|uniref:uncharacterized protein LOC122926101 n=1 Tax=Bufo gargarizans TaxID=30331 RepID=UPI001CF4B40C|nr:uncharacterized protein LOC122926101 [Bufo gargarizans]
MATSSENLDPDVFTYSKEDELRILQGTERDTTFLFTPTILDTKKRFEYDSKRLINLELHMFTLCEYHQNHRIPRGMRSQLRPDLFPNNADFCARFSQICNKFAFDMILLNIEFLQKEILSLQDALQTTTTALKNVLPAAEFDAYIASCAPHFEKLRAELQDKKRQKWSRDMEDYTRGFIYIWQRDPKNPRGGDRRQIHPSDKRHTRSQSHNKSQERVEANQQATCPKSFLGLGTDPIEPGGAANATGDGEDRNKNLRPQRQKVVNKKRTQ